MRNYCRFWVLIGSYNLTDPDPVHVDFTQFFNDEDQAAVYLENNPYPDDTSWTFQGAIYFAMDKPILQQHLQAAYGATQYIPTGFPVDYLESPREFLDENYPG